MASFPSLGTRKPDEAHYKGSMSLFRHLILLVLLLVLEDFWLVPPRRLILISIIVIIILGLLALWL